MIPYCLYCNLPIQDGEECLAFAKHNAILTCDYCGVSYTWIKINNEFCVTGFTITLNNMCLSAIIPPIINHFDCYLRIKKQYISIPIDNIFLPIDTLSKRFNNLLPFI